MKKHLAIIVATLLCLACRESSRREINNNVDYTRMDTVILSASADTPLDKIIKDVQIVRLANTGDILIGEVSGLFVTDDHIIVADYNKSQAVFIFDRSGKSTAVINRLGSGPQEYKSIDYVTLSPDETEIILLDNLSKKLIYYDFQGQFQQSKPMSFYADRVTPLGAETFLITTYGLQGNDPGLASYAYNTDLVFRVDSSLEVINSIFPSKYTSDQFHSKSPSLKKFNNNVYVTPSYCDTIYQITPNEIQARYWIDMSAAGGKALFDTDITSDQLFELVKTTLMFNNTYVDTESFAFFRFLSKEGETVLFSKTTKKSYTLDMTSRAPFNIFFGQSSTSFKEQFIAAIPAYHVLSICRNQPEFSNLTEDDNPVVFFFTTQDPE